jgi:hypothetical protein
MTPPLPRWAPPAARSSHIHRPSTPPGPKLRADVGQAGRRLDDLAAQLARGKTRKARPSVEAEIATICKPRWVDRVIKATLTGQDPADLRLRWEIDQAARDRLAEEVFGKRLLWTNRDDWPVGEVVAPTAPNQASRTGSGR